MHTKSEDPALDQRASEDELVPLHKYDDGDVVDDDEENRESVEMNHIPLHRRRKSACRISTCILSFLCVILLLGAAALGTSIMRLNKLIAHQNDAITQQTDAIAQYELEVEQFRSMSIAAGGQRPGNLTTKDWKKPEDIKIVGMIFFGRPYTLDILDCYLKRNLARNGGFLDEVHFMYHPRTEEADRWLDDQLARTPEYKKIDEDGVTKNCTITNTGEEECDLLLYGDMWVHATGIDTIYVKIDDDIVYMHDDAIPSLVNSLILHPEAYLIFSNTINSAVDQWLHWHTGAIYPYLPEPREAEFEARDNTSWRPSELPLHPVDADELPLNFNVDKAEPPFVGHRWLPLENTPVNLAKSPIAQGLYGPFGYSWRSWALAAQQHYSLLQNLEQNTMWKYIFGDGEGLWNMQFTRNSINVMAIWGRTVAEHLPSGRPDERQLTSEIPLLLNRPTYIDSKSIVSHFHYSTQRGLMIQTDLLNRYRAYANEMVCTPDNQKYDQWSL